MTDTEQKEICRIAHINDISDLSDGYHTFRQLYYQRMILFATIVKQNKDKAWKSLRHSDGELCFGGGWFIVGIDTPEGSYTYHYEDNYFSLFDCVELERGKTWDGHTEKDVTRLLSLKQESCEDAISRQVVLKQLKGCLIGGETEYQYVKLHIDNVPSVTPQPKTGYWISANTGKQSRLKDGMTTENVKCSECGEWLTGSDEYQCNGNFCPNCGADIREVEE